VNGGAIGIRVAGIIDLTFLGEGRGRERGQHNTPIFIIFFFGKYDIR